MEDEKRSGGGDSSRPSSSFVKTGDRQVFAVELRPGETTIVSWKKLVKDSNKVDNGYSASASASVAPVPAPVPEPPANAHPRLESRIAPASGGQVQQSGDEANEEAATNRFSAVIEKIERLYMGKDSSDDEDMNDIPDDDQYDTEDSFIDDAELDEYFEVDNSAIKHDGFFVNRGKLERIEMTAQPNQQPKKRRRKDFTKGNGENDDGRLPSKHTKLGKSAAAKIPSAHAKNLSTSTQHVAVSGEHNEDSKIQTQLNASSSCLKKKSYDGTKPILDPSFLKVSNGDTSVTLAEAKDVVDKQKAGLVLSKDPSSKLKDVAVSSDTSHQKYHDKNSYTQSRPQSVRALGSGDDFESPVRAKDKNGIREQPDLNTFEGKYSAPMTKSSHMHKKDGSSARSKSSLLEKSIRELEKMVAESRPPAGENPEADNYSQAVKRRLPREIKTKLGKVARLAASHGKVSKELLNRLMSILGHIIQLRTLKRNLKIMISMSLSDKQEKDDRFQLVKKEVIDMIKMRAPSMESKALEQQAGASDDFQETATEEKEAPKRKFSMEAALEDKICDLYDLYVDGLDEDAGPQIRKLYADLAQLWPIGYMDNHGIKRAICRAKDRRRALYNRNKDQEKLKRKKMLVAKAEEGVRTEGNSVLPAQYGRDRPTIDSAGQNPMNKQVSGTARMPSPLRVPPPNHDKPKQDRLKGSSGNSPLEDARVSDGAPTKKKVKRKPENIESDETRHRPEKLPSQQQQGGEERPKPIKQHSALAAALPPPKASLQSTVPPSLEQSS